MLYNQPLDQPSNPNAPYVDGNPKGGIAGSIVPAASLEYDQREVVEVINVAYTRGYTDFSSTPCAIPSNSDLKQLRKAIEGFIHAMIITPSWYIDTNVVYTVHGTSPKYADLNIALEDISKYIITHNGYVTLNIAAGRWNYGTNGISLDHPNADRIVITGQNITTLPVNADYPCTGYSATARQADRTNTLTNLRAKIPTEIEGTFSNYGTGLVLKNMLITGDRATYGDLSVQSGTIFINNVAVVNGYVGVGQGLLALQNGAFFSGTGSTMHGLGVASGGNMWIGNGACSCWFNANDWNGIGAGFDCGANGYAMVIAKGNGGAGLMCSVMGQFQTGYNCQFSTNANAGVFIDQGNFYTLQGSVFQNNANAGLYVTVDSSAQLDPGCSFSGNGGGYNVVVGAGSYLNASGCPGIVGYCTPTANVLDSSGAYIFANE
jgi:hypothetical protein